MGAEKGADELSLQLLKAEVQADLYAELLSLARLSGLLQPRR